MSTTRFFSGGRDPGKGRSGVAYEMMRTQISKKGKVSAKDRFKAITQQKLEQSKQDALFRVKPFSLPGAQESKRTLSKHTLRLLNEMAKKKAAKKLKAERKRVVVQPRNFSNGSIARSGRITDIAGNVVAKVNLKNGKMNLNGLAGWGLGHYKPGPYTNSVIQGAIDKYSPYYINLRKMQEMQQGQGGVWGSAASDVISVHGRSVGSVYSPVNNDTGVFGDYSSDQAGPRQNVGATAWGAMSDNTWGTFSDNVWGTSADTVWGTNTSDVWGGIGGSPFGKGVRIWGSGNGNNYLKGLTARVAAFFGLNLKTKASRAAFHEAVNAVRSSKTGATTRAGADHHSNAAPATRAPVNTSRR